MSSIAMLEAVVAVMATVATVARPIAMVPLVIWFYNCFSPKLTHIPSFAKGEIRVSGQKLATTKLACQSQMRFDEHH